MKTNLLFTLCILFTVSLSAQKVAQAEMPTSYGNQTAYSVDLEGADSGMVEDAWKDYLSDFGKVKRNKKAKEWYCEDCRISVLSTNAMQVLLKIDQRKGMTVASAFFDNGSNFISSDNDPESAALVEKFMENFALDVEKRVISEDLEEQEKKLKDFNKDLEKLEKKNLGYHNDIDNYKKKIIEAEENIEKNLKEQESKRMEIKDQVKTVEGVTEKLNNVGKK